MYAKYILGILAIVFLILGSARFSSNKIQARTWLLVGAIFAIVSILLFFKGV